MIRFDNLDSIPFTAIHDCFMRAFEDYAVGMAAVTESALKRRAKKNNWTPCFSCGVRSGEQLVAITLIGIDELAGEKIAYDICTGVVPEFRGQGLAGLMMDEIRPRLRKARVDFMQLEVLEENAAAISAYKRAGFREVRRLVSYSGSAAGITAHPSSFRVDQIRLADLLEVAAEQEFQPSFEQRDQAIGILEDELIIQGAFSGDQLVAAIAHDPYTDWLMRVVTKRTKRRQGAASALLNNLARQLKPDAPVKAINMDGADSDSQALMKSIGLKETLGQLEMRLDLT